MWSKVWWFHWLKLDFTFAIRFKLTVPTYSYIAIGNSTNKKDAQTNAAIDFCQYLVREGKMSQNEIEVYLVNISFNRKGQEAFIFVQMNFI